MEFSNKFSEINVLIVGDIMLDRYWWGRVSRISPEAPVPIVNLGKVSLRAGGAANVALNVAGLGARPFLVGLVGDDEEADLVFQTLEKHDVSTDFLVKSETRPTTVKTRIMAHSQQIARVDQEIKKDVSTFEEKNILEKIEFLFDEINIVIVSDYGKGVLSENLTSRLITSAIRKHKLVLIDPKGKNYAKYRNGTMLTPNRFEVIEACNLEECGQTDINDAGNKLLSELSLESLLITQGEDGMTLFEKTKTPVHLSAESRHVYDVTGAGDTVIACLAVAIAAGADYLTAAKFANRAAGLVVEQIGTTAISLEMLAQAR